MSVRVAASAALVLMSAAAGPVFAQADLACQRCHGELELLRQHVRTLGEARALLVLEADLAGSAHEGMSCARCHTGFARFPHPAGARTTQCAACHEEAEAGWRRGIHAGAAGLLGGEGAEQVSCTQCHGVHTVAETATAAGPALVAMIETCASCHETQRLLPGDPHQVEVGCHACHGPHEVRRPVDPASRMARHNQARVCGACHEAVFERWAGDAHGLALYAEAPAAHDPFGAPGPPTCSSCHGAHPVAPTGERGFSAAAVDRCVACHEQAGRTFFGTYHGKATVLGSLIVATCADCHSAHGIFPASDPRSTVAEANLVETCQSCHAYARPAFVLYDSHPEPFNRARNPYIFYSFWFMNTLLIGTLLVFGLHTLAWWIRIVIDRRRGVVHGPGAGHAPGQGPDPGAGGSGGRHA